MNDFKFQKTYLNIDYYIGTIWFSNVSMKQVRLFIPKEPRLLESIASYWTEHCPSLRINHCEAYFRQNHHCYHSAKTHVNALVVLYIAPKRQIYSFLFTDSFTIFVIAVTNPLLHVSIILSVPSLPLRAFNEQLFACHLCGSENRTLQILRSDITRVHGRADQMISASINFLLHPSCYHTITYHCLSTHHRHKMSTIKILLA